MNYRRPLSLASCCSRANRPLPRAVLTALLLLLTAHCSLLTAFAQSATATLSGTVEDQQSAVVPGVEITVLNVETSAKRQATTKEDGSFIIPLLPPGRYSITARREGFAPVEVPNVVLNVADQKSLQIQLKAGDINAQVQVTNDAQLINESPAVGTVIDRQFVSNLPLNGRSFQSLILLTPGVVLMPSSQSAPGEFSVNGQRQNTNYFTVDGVSANTGIGVNTSLFSQQAGGAVPGLTALGTTSSLVSIDALEEFKIQTSGYSAELGRQPGGQVQLVTRSGGNEFHGTAFEYLRHEAFDATDWFSNARRLPKAKLRQNQFGGTFSGPVILPRFGEGGRPFWSGRNKTFFFFSYEGQRLQIPAPNAANVVVPALWLRQAAAPALQPFLNAYPLPTGPEIQVVQDPNLPLQPDPNLPNYNPLIPSGSAPFESGYSSPASVDASSIRVDHAVNSKLTLFGRYAQTPSNSLRRDLSQLQGTVSTNRTLTLGTTSSVTSRLSNELRFNWTSNRSAESLSMDNFGGATPTTVDPLVAPYSGPGPKLAIFSWGRGWGTSLLFGDSADNHQRQINVTDNISWSKGNHLLKFGLDWRHLTPIMGPTAYQLDVFPATSNNLDYADAIRNLISGTLPVVLTSANKGVRPIYDNFSAYAQDTWKVSPRLTLDLGLRWEVNPPPHDANGVEPVLVQGINDFDLSRATLAPPGTPFYKTIYTAFAPRFGLAYQLNQASGRETILRGGFGVYYDLGNEQASAGFSGYPFSSRAGFFNVPFPLTSAQAVQPPFPAVQLPLTGVTLQALNENLKLPYTLQWNVSLERSLGKQQTINLSYVASAARRLTITQFMNLVPANAIIVNPRDTYRSNPSFGDILFTRNAPTSDYQSLQVRYQRRLSRGLQALVNYTWSRAMDQASTSGDVQGTLDRSYAAFDVRHNLSAAVTYDLPKLSGTGPIGLLAKGIANGWSIDSIFFARSGLPLDLFTDATTLPNGNFVIIRPDVVPGVPVWIKDPTVPGGRRLNTSAFTLPPFTTNPSNGGRIYERTGTSARNSVRLPGIYQLNMAVRRQFNLGERLKLQLKAEAFNVLNHPLFTGYDRRWRPTRPTFGVPSAILSNGMGDAALNSLYQLGGPRSMQFSARLSF